MGAGLAAVKRNACQKTVVEPDPMNLNRSHFDNSTLDRMLPISHNGLHQLLQRQLELLKHHSSSLLEIVAGLGGSLD